MARLFWEQYTYGVGTETYGFYDTIEDAVRAPFSSNGVNRDGRDLWLKPGENEKKKYIGHQPMHYPASESDSIEWQEHAAKLNSIFNAVEGAAEILANAQKKNIKAT